MKKHINTFGLMTGILMTGLLVVGLLPMKAFAASATVYVSPGTSTITKGSSVTVAMRVNLGSDPANAVEARLNFDSSKLQYSSHSFGGSPFDIGIAPSIGGSSITVSRAGTGGAVTGDRLVASVTFNTIASGNAGLSVSNITVANGGSAFGSVSGGSGSVSVQEPASSPTPPPSGSGGSGGSSSSGQKKKATSQSPSSPANSQAVPAADTSAPTVTNTPSVTKTQSTITIRFKTSEPTTAVATYGMHDARDKKVTAALASEHALVLGKDPSLSPGTTYGVAIQLVDATGNSTQMDTITARTTGVMYQVKITDKTGKLLANYPVELHSDPIKTTSDKNGIATFQDVTPGEHTLILTISGVTVRQPVRVGVPVSASGDSRPTAIPLPFSVSGAVAAPNSPTWLLLLIGAFVGGGLTFAVLHPRTRILVGDVAKTTHKKIRDHTRKKPVAEQLEHNDNNKHDEHRKHKP